MPSEIVNIPLKAKYVAMRPPQWNSSGDAWAAAQIQGSANTFMNESPKAQLRSFDPTGDGRAEQSFNLYNPPSKRNLAI